MSKLGGLENPRGVIHYTGSIYACRATTCLLYYG